MSEPLALPRLKVCGVRALRDVESAFDLGLDAIGLVAWRHSPRYVDVERAAALVRELPRAVLAIGVFVDASPGDAREWLASTGARGVQLCGGERAADWSAFPALIVRRIAVDAQAEREIDAWQGVARAFVLDHPSSAGGTGREVDATRAALLARRAPCLLAGGLDASNVEERVRSVRPHGVDASSRLESAPGVKDAARVTAFVRRAHAALRALEREDAAR
jgi:phosphoribosylanthranilate isomerase